MPDFSIAEIIGKVVELRDRMAEIGKRHEQELAPLSGAKQALENVLLHKMNELGVDQFKGETGTAFRSTHTSVSLKEPGEFRQFVFEPAVVSIANHFAAMGMPVSDNDLAKIADIIRDLPRWDVVDLRAGKKGIQEYQENFSRAVPGVAVTSVASVNIRRA